MRGGQNAIPAEQRRREGDRSHRPPVDPVLVGGRVDEAEQLPVPPHFSRQMRAVWRIVVDDLREGGILDRADLSMVEAFAVSLGRAREIRTALALITREARKNAAAEKDPTRRLLAAAGYGHLLAETVRGSTAQPLLAKEKDYLTEARQLGVDLGLSPRARTHLGLDAKGSLKAKSMQGELARKLGASPRLVEGGKTA